MNVLILGANGHVGSRITHELIARGHTVVASVHRNKANVPKEATVIALNIQNQAEVEQALTGIDAVVCALSSWHAPDHNILGMAMRSVIPAMQHTGVRRIISISGDIARLPGEKPNWFVKLFHQVAFGPVRRVVADSEDHLRQLYESSLDWTVIRPTIMTSANDRRYTLLQRHPRNLTIPRAAVVACIVDLIEASNHIHEAPFLGRR